jgi:hypothetical protein
LFAVATRNDEGEEPDAPRGYPNRSPKPKTAKPVEETDVPAPVLGSIVISVPGDTP